MRVRTTGLAVFVAGILIGAGGCSADSPTSPLAPAEASQNKGGYAGAGTRQDSTTTTTGGGYAGAGTVVEDPTASTSAFGGYAGAGH